jgi:hypothetical protein
VKVHGEGKKKKIVVCMKGRNNSKTSRIIRLWRDASVVLAELGQSNKTKI